MSRAGRVTLVRPTRAERVQSLVADAAREMAPACEQACGFFFQGLADFITAPVSESAAGLAEHVSRQGARHLDILVPELAARYDGLAQSISQRALQLHMEVPPALVLRPPVITAEAVRLQEEALRFVDAGPVHAIELNAVAARLEEERSRMQHTFDLASLVAGYDDETARQAAASFSALIHSGEDGGREALREQIASWAAGARQKLERETEQTWSAVALAAARLALQDAGLAPEQADVAGGKVVGRDASDPRRQMEVHVAPESGEIRYELSGYKGGQCQPVEQRFLEALSGLLGAELSPQNLRHWETAAACVQPPQTVAPARLAPRFTGEKAGAQTGRERQRS